MKSMPPNAKLFIGALAVAGLAALAGGLMQWECKDAVRFLSLLLVATIASRLKIKLPGVNGNMSVNLPFILIAMMELSLSETLMIALASTLAQCFPQDRGRPKALQTLFNLSTMAVAVGLAGLIFRGRVPLPTVGHGPLLLCLAAASFLLAQTIPVATIISLTEGGSVPRIWSSLFQLSFPYYVLSAGVASLVTTASHRMGWQIPLLVLPAMYGVYRSYRLYFGRQDTAALPIAVVKAA